MGDVWHRTLRHIKERRHLEVYAVLLVILAVSVLGLFGKAGTKTVAAAVLLGLIPLTLIGLTILDALEASADSSSTWLRKAWPPQLDNRMKSSTDSVVMVGVALSRSLTNYGSELERRLQAGQSVGIVVVDPEGSYGPLLSAQREYGRPNVEKNRQLIKASITTVDDLLRSRNELARRVSLFLVDFPIGVGGILFDASLVFDAKSKRYHLLLGRSPEMYIERYPFGISGYEHEHLLVSRQHPHWLEHFRREFENLSNSGRRLPIPKGPRSV